MDLLRIPSRDEWSTGALGGQNDAGPIAAPLATIAFPGSRRDQCAESVVCTGISAAYVIAGRGSNGGQMILGGHARRYRPHKYKY
jgi:hypothetical protein